VAKGRDANREESWREILQRRAVSGMTVNAFCEQEGLKPSAYHYWQREIKRRDADRPAQRSTTAKVPALVPVQLVDDCREAAAVEIVVNNGYRIRVSPEATTEHLSRVLQAVAELD